MMPRRIISVILAVGTGTRVGLASPSMRRSDINPVVPDT